MVKNKRKKRIFFLFGKNNFTKEGESPISSSIFLTIPLQRVELFGSIALKYLTIGGKKHQRLNIQERDTDSKQVERSKDENKSFF